MNTPATRAKKTSRARPLAMQFLERGLVAFAIIGSLLSVWWSINRLTRFQQQSSTVTQQASRISTEIELMEAQLAPGKTQEVALRFDKARRDLFAGGESVAAWRDALNEDAVPLALQTQLTIDGTSTSNVGDHLVTLIKATVEITPSPDVPSSQSGFERVLSFVHQLTTQTQRVDLLELRVQGGSNSVDRAFAAVELWAMDPERP